MKKIETSPFYLSQNELNSIHIEYQNHINNKTSPTELQAKIANSVLKDYPHNDKPITIEWDNGEMKYVME